jgi:hypothetical protein
MDIGRQDADGLDHGWSLSIGGGTSVALNRFDVKAFDQACYRRDWQHPEVYNTSVYLPRGILWNKKSSVGCGGCE